MREAIVNRDGLAVRGVHAEALVRHRGVGGDVLFEETVHNIWHDEGEEWMVKTCFTEEDSVPANFYMGLDSRTSLAEADGLSDLTDEPSGNGYARAAVASDDTDWTASQDAGDWQVASKTVTYTASGGSIAADNVFLTDVSTGSTGDLFLSLALSQSRTLADGESLDVTVTIKVSE